MSSNIIEGFKVDVSTDELAAHLQLRIDHHRGEVGKLEIKIGKLKDHQVEMERVNEAASVTVPRGGIIGCGDPMQTFEAQKQLHADSVDYFTWVETHLIPNAVYRLNADDLGTLEISGARRSGSALFGLAGL